MDKLFEMSGVDFDVEEAIRHSPLHELAETWKRGQTFGLRGKHSCKDSGFSVCIGGDDEADLDRQIADALVFLRDQSDEIRRLRAWPGVTKASLRFGEYWYPEKTVARFSHFSSDLLLACGQLGLEIFLFEYLTSDISENEQKTN
jgi:hypothetical protein